MNIEGRGINLLGLFILVGSFSIYLFTLAPTVVWGDGATFACFVHRFRLPTFGSPGAHPLYIIIGKMFSFLPGEIAWNLNLMSAFFASLTLLFICLMVYKITASKTSSMIASSALGLSHTFWQHAVIAEVYTFNAFFVSLIILFALKWRDNPQDDKWMLLSFLTLIVGLTNHLILALILPGILFLILVTRPQFFLQKKYLGAALVIVILGLGYRNILKGVIIQFLTDVPYMYNQFRLPQDFPSFMKELLLYFSYFIYQFPGLGIVMGLLGVVHLIKNDRGLGLFLTLLIGTNTLFWVKNTYWTSLGSEKYVFYIPDYVIFSIFIGYGASVIIRWLDKLRDTSQFRTLYRLKGFAVSKGSYILVIGILALPVLTYNLTPSILKRMNRDVLKARDLPFRDNYEYFLNPSKRGYYGARIFGERTFEVMARNSFLFADSTPFSILKYLQTIEGMRTDVKLINTSRVKIHSVVNFINSKYKNPPIYVVDINEGRGYYDFGMLWENYSFIPMGPIFQIIKKPNRVKTLRFANKTVPLRRR